MMSHRGKRQGLSRLDDITPVTTKRRKGRTSTTTEEEEEAPSLEHRPSYSTVASMSSDMKISSIYNRSVTEAPAELFRKDLISAMKLPDSEPLTSDHYWVITDQWKQEWERGVQVPVKPDSLPGPVVSIASSHVNPRRMHHEYKLPKSKYIRITKDEHFRVDEHYLSNVGIQAEKCCAYDLEDVDVVWLNILNGERACMGLKPITQDQLERIIEELEMRCWEKVNAIVKKEEGLALEFDESVICDVCRSPDSEDGNEMVFCDTCNICVHQACYGITSIPSGQWLCRTCSLKLRPECVLCPNKNGAMKSTRSGQKWAHVSCALWIPEVSIGCVEKMEPITKISSIPPSRWALICVLCRERVGACIQCSVKTCKTAYHVTCAFKHGLEMRAIIDEESTAEDDNTVKLRSYCQKHGVSSKKENAGATTGSDDEVKRFQRKDMTTEEKTHARAVKLQEIEAEFEKHVNVNDITRKYDVDTEGLEYIYNYWVLKRRSSFNKPLLAARTEDASDLLNKNEEAVDQEKMRMFVQLRQDLERVRNLCYMVSRREKLSRTYQKLREQTFYKQAAMLSDPNLSLSTAEITAIKDANHGPSIYDRLYSHPNAPDLSTDFETMIHRIAGQIDPQLSPRHGVNGFIFSSSKKDSKRFNGDICKDSYLYESLSSCTSDIDTKSHIVLETESDAHGKVNNRMNKSQRKNNVENRIKNTARRRKKSSSTVSYFDSPTSSEPEDDNDVCSNSKEAQQKQSLVSRSFGLLEQLGSRSGSISTGDDDTEVDLFILRKRLKSKSKKNKITKIYTSDSDSSGKDKFSSTPRKQVPTKASVKEFTGSGRSNRSSKDGNRNNSLSKSITFSSTKSSAMTLDKRKKRVDDLFDVESDDAHLSECKMLPNEGDSSKNLMKESENVFKSKNKLKNDTKNEKKLSPMMEKKARKDVLNDSFQNDGSCSSNNANYLDTLTLVPQRAAAKKAIKAIEHIKNGMVKPTTNFDESEMDVLKISSKSSKLLKKEQQSASSKQKFEVKDIKEIKSATDKRVPAKLISTALSISTPTRSLNLSSYAPNTTVGVTTSVAVPVPISSISTSISSAVPTGVVKSASRSGSSKSASSSSSESSSGSSSSGSSSSSSSASSSDSSSSGSSSSSSSSESESEDPPCTVAKKLPNVEPTTFTTGVSVPSPVSDSMKQTSNTINKKSINNKTEPRSVVIKEETRPEVTFEKYSEITIVKPKSINAEPEKDDYLMVDKNSILETERAIEHLTINEQNFMLPSSCWETSNIEKEEVKMESGSFDDEKLRNRSLFSPKDFDFHSFDDDLNENNNLNDGSFSLSSLSLLGVDLTCKADTKEDSVRETLNLVEKLKLEMARKQSNHGENSDSLTTNSPNLIGNKTMLQDNLKHDEDKVKSDDSTASECSQLTISSNTVAIISNDNLPPSIQIPIDSHPEVDIFSAFSSGVLEPKPETTPNKQSEVRNHSPNSCANWTQLTHPCEESNSPYQDVAHTDRWSESVMMPSKRSNCSSASLSSNSSSSAYSETHQVNEMFPNHGGVSRIDSVSIDMQHIPKSVNDLSIPAAVPHNLSFPCKNIPDSTYGFPNFHTSTPMSDKTLFPHVIPQVSKPSSLFSTPMFGSMGTYTRGDQLLSKPYGQTLSIQTPCAATASFTTTSQNMAMITSIISPMPPPLCSDEMAVAPLAISGSNSFTEEVPELIAELTGESGVCSIDTVGLCTHSPVKRSAEMTYLNDTEKENNQLLTNLNSRSMTPTPVDTVCSLAEKNDNETETETHKATEGSVSITDLFSNDSSTATTPVATPQPKTPQMTDSKQSLIRPLRVSARVMSQNKSPVAKSPVSAGVSPARPETLPISGKSKNRDGGTRKNYRVKTTTNRRGRGRGRGRNAFPNCFYRDWECDTITDKLVGTVYDFDDDEETPNDNFENLRAMRERRKSTDTAYCDKLSTSSKDTYYSPKFASPSLQQPNSKRKGSLPSTPDRRTSVIQKDDLYFDNQASPEDDEDEEEEEGENEDHEAVEEDEEDHFDSMEKSTSVSAPSKNSRKVSSNSPTLLQPLVKSSSVEQFAAMQPLMPGPINIRTCIDDAYNNTVANAIFSHATNISESILDPAFPLTTSFLEPIPDIVNALEKEIQKCAALPISKKSSPMVSSPCGCADAAVYTNCSSPNHFLTSEQHVETTSVLLGIEHTVSRNQLKVKIKGPYSDANYAAYATTTSSITTVQQLSSVPNSGPSTDGFPSSVAFVNTSAASSASSSNLRRMRKKELLEQYKAQGQDESGNDITAPYAISTTFTEANLGITSNASLKSGPTYKLPKAVASMTTIPTKEDYKAVLETAAYIEKKKRGKDKSVRLDASDVTSNNNYGNNNSHKQQATESYMRSLDQKSAAVEGNGTKRKSRNAMSATPKLRIKIGCGTASALVYNTAVCSVISPEEKNLRLRPPKKRLCDQTDVQPMAPNVEQLKRECMRYRSQVISEFNEKGKTLAYDDFSDNENTGRDNLTGKHLEASSKKRKKHSSSAAKSSRRKRKQQKGRQENDESRLVRVIESVEGPGSGRAPKLIIKFGGLSQPPEASSFPSLKSSKSSRGSTNNDTRYTSHPSRDSEPRPTKLPKSSKRNLSQGVDSVCSDKITPIRLKIKRSKEGYVSKSEVLDDGQSSNFAPVAILPDLSIRADASAKSQVDTAGAPVAIGSGTEEQVFVVSLS